MNLKLNCRFRLKDPHQLGNVRHRLKDRRVSYHMNRIVDGCYRVQR
jgi:hypothetical protein